MHKDHSSDKEAQRIIVNTCFQNEQIYSHLANS